MTIAIDVSPLSSGHSVRGVGFYLQHLKDSLLKYDKKNKYYFFTDYSTLSSSIDIVHYPYFDPFFPILPYKKRFPFIVTVHDLIPLLFPKYFPSGLKGRVKWEFNKLLLSKADLVVTDSYASSRDAARLTALSSEKIKTVYLAAGEEFRPIKDMSSLRKVKEKYSLPDEFVLYVGDVTWNKNLPGLIRAIKNTSKKLVLVGKTLSEPVSDINNPWNKSLLEAKKYIKGDEQFITLGFIPSEDLVAIYNLATVMAFPSFYEGFGLPVLEAMQSGCPVVTSHAGSLKEIASEGAYIIDPNDIVSIKNGITKVFESKQLRSELIKNGLRQADKFSWAKTASQMIALYQSLSQT